MKLFALVLAALPLTPTEGSLDSWIATETAKARAAIAANTAAPGAAPGVVIASPSLAPNYVFHWARDAALTMTVVDDLDRIRDYTDFTRQTQLVDTPSGRVSDHFANLGEPKFNIDGTPFTGDWGRPQSDGPALQVIALMRHPEAGSDRGPVLDTDLDYLAHHAQETCFDLWEETRGHHFYTELVQRRALLLGASAAATRGDLPAMRRYRRVARQLSRSLTRHWDGRRGFLVETLGRDGGVDYKFSNLDSGVILGALHAAGDDDFFAPWDDRVLATAAVLTQRFKGLYPINRNTNLAPAIGRYPEDRYDGATNVGGNPWALITLGMAELHYRVARELAQRGWVVINHRNAAFYGRHAGTMLRRGDRRFQALLSRLLADGDGFLERVRHHTDASGGLSEQIDRSDGAMRSAHDLTWSYAAFLTAVEQRALTLTSREGLGSGHGQDSLHRK